MSVASVLIIHLALGAVIWFELQGSKAAARDFFVAGLFFVCALTWSLSTVIQDHPASLLEALRTVMSQVPGVRHLVAE